MGWWAGGSVGVSVSLSVWLAAVCLSVRLSVCLSVYLSVCLSVYLSGGRAVGRSDCLSSINVSNIKQLNVAIKSKHIK